MNERLAAFSDGVFAIAITILVLDVKVPPIESAKSVANIWVQIGKLWPTFFAMTLTFVIILISWIGHHNYVKMLHKTSAKFQFANGFFLFTVMLYPFATAFMAEYFNTPFAQPAVVLYCLTALLHNIGWNVFYRSMLKPVVLVKQSDLETVKKAAQGARFGFIIYISLSVLAWWLPYVAILLSLVLWIYWIYISTSIGSDEPETLKKGSAEV